MEGDGVLTEDEKDNALIEAITMALYYGAETLDQIAAKVKKSPEIVEQKLKSDFIKYKFAEKVSEKSGDKFHLTQKGINEAHFIETAELGDKAPMHYTEIDPKNLTPTQKNLLELLKDTTPNAPVNLYTQYFEDHEYDGTRRRFSWEIAQLEGGGYLEWADSGEGQHITERGRALLECISKAQK